MPRIVLVSVDPERDSPEILGQYIDYFGDGNLGLTGTLEEIRKLTGGLGIYFQKQSGDDDGADYSVDHSAAVLVIDPDGGFHAVFSGRHVVDNFVHDLPILMGDRLMRLSSLCSRCPGRLWRTQAAAGNQRTGSHGTHAGQAHERRVLCSHEQHR